MTPPKMPHFLRLPPKAMIPPKTVKFLTASAIDRHHRNDGAPFLLIATTSRAEDFWVSGFVLLLSSGTFAKTQPPETKFSESNRGVWSISLSNSAQRNDEHHSVDDHLPVAFGLGDTNHSRFCLHRAFCPFEARLGLSSDIGSRIFWVAFRDHSGLFSRLLLPYANGFNRRRRNRLWLCAHYARHRGRMAFRFFHTLCNIGSGTRRDHCPNYRGRLWMPRRSPRSAFAVS